MKYVYIISLIVVITAIILAISPERNLGLIFLMVLFGGIAILFAYRNVADLEKPHFLKKDKSQSVDSSDNDTNKR